VIVFAFTVQNAEAWFTAHNFPPSPILSMVIFLLTFIVSALICSSLVFLQSVRLFAEGQKDAAWKLFFGSVAWLAFFLVFFGAITLLTL